MKSRAIRLTSITVAAWLAAYGTAHACPVCVGVSDSPLAAGMNAGVLVLLGVTTVVLGGIFFAGRRIVRASGGTHPSAQRPAPVSEARPEADPC